MRRRLPRLVLALAAHGAATALAAGGGGDPSAPTIDDLAQVADRTTDAGTASFVLRVDQTLGSQTVSMSANGAFDTASDRARLSADLSGLANALSGPGNALPGLDDPTRWRLQALRDETHVYLSSPLLQSALPPGKSWVSADVEKLAAEHGIDLGQLRSLGASDPRDLLDLLRATSGGLDRIGTEAVRGVETTHYRAALDPERLVELVGKDAGVGLVGGILELIARSGLEEVPVDVWVDDDSLLRRLEATVTVESGIVGASTAKLAVELFDHGRPVEVTPPPASEVAGLDELRHR